MGKAKILTGARAKILIGGTPCGLFSNCSWSIRQQKVPAFILGRFNPAEIVPVSQEPVELRLTGYRVVDSGPYAVANATMLKGLLDEEDFSVVIMDRLTGKAIFTAQGCRVQGWNSGVQARGVSDITIDIIGIRGEDEHGTATGGDDEIASAASLDDGT